MTERALRRRRLLRAAGAVAAGALAGCSSLDDWSTTADSRETETRAGETATVADTSARTDVTMTGTDARTDSATVAALEDEIAAVKSELLAARIERAFARGWRSLYPGGFEESTLDAADRLYERHRDSVVQVGEQSTDRHQRTAAAGTGWFVSPTEIVTNSHVVRTQRPQHAFLADGTKINVTHVGSGSGDIALLRTDHEGTPLELGDPTDLSFGQPLVGIGHPGSFGSWTGTVGRFITDGERFAASSKSGIGTGRSIGEGQIATTVPAQGGSSGSPTMTLDGTVVGMVFGVFGRPTGPDAVEPIDPFVYEPPLTRPTGVRHEGSQKIRAQIEAIKD